MTVLEVSALGERCSNERAKLVKWHRSQGGGAGEAHCDDRASKVPTSGRVRNQKSSSRPEGVRSLDDCLLSEKEPQTGEVHDGILCADLLPAMRGYRAVKWDESCSCQPDKLAAVM